jgi:hypothetical protein
MQSFACSVAQFEPIQVVGAERFKAKFKTRIKMNL